MHRVFWPMVVLALCILHPATPSLGQVPAGRKQASIVGSKKTGKVWVTRWVESFPGGKFRYHFLFENKGSRAVRLRTQSLEEWTSSQPVEPGCLFDFCYDEAKPPVSRLCRIVLQVRVNGAWVAGGVWYQKLPVPKK